jgi:hypothetical protein
MQTALVDLKVELLVTWADRKYSQRIWDSLQQLIYLSFSIHNYKAINNNYLFTLAIELECDEIVKVFGELTVLKSHLQAFLHSVHFVFEIILISF